MPGWRKTYPERLEEMATKHQFLLCEDRKFVDITAANQLFNSVFKMLNWADFITATILCGQGCISGLKLAIAEKGRQDAVGLIILAEAACYAAFTHGHYTRQCIRIAKHYPEAVLGFIALGKPTEDNETDFVTFATDIDLHRERDGYTLCQTPETAIRRGADVIFVGKALNLPELIEHQDQVDQLKQLVRGYQTQGWNAYEKVLAEQAAPYRGNPYVIQAGLYVVSSGQAAEEWEQGVQAGFGQRGYPTHNNSQGPAPAPW
jgi:hypothetical protein